MNEALPLTFSQPAWLLLLPLPWLLAWYGQRDRARRLARLVAPALWPLLVRGPGDSRRGITPLFMAAWALALLAATDPRLPGMPSSDDPARPPPGPDLALVVDISPSMEVTDVAPTRLARARFELHDYLARRPGGRTALVAYSAQAYELLPLTADRDTLAHFIAALDSGLTRRHGSNLTMALEIASRLLDPSPPGARAVLLVSDGEIHEADSARGAARRLADRGIPLLILGVGTPAGGPVRDALGRFLRHEDRPVISRRNDALLAELAALGGGRYVPATDDDRDWSALFEALNRLDAAVPASPGTDPAPRDTALYPWLLAPGLALFLWLGFRHHPALPLLLVCLLPLPPAQAAEGDWRWSPQAVWHAWQEQRAHEALTAGDYERAMTLYGELGGFRGALGKGTAAYRLQDWARALAGFEAAARLAATPEERLAAAYNTGTTLLRLGRLAEAETALRKALRLDPEHRPAALNLALLQRLKRQRLKQSPDTVARDGDRPDASSDDGPPPQVHAFPSRRGSDAPPPEETDSKPVARDGPVAATPRFLTAAGEDTALLLRLRIDAQEEAFAALPETRPW